ncbi:MAG: adenosine kinase [Parvibaculales bacterium]
MTNKRFHVTAMGAALVDVYAQISDDQLTALGSQKGAMTLIDADQAATMLDALVIESRASGGSAANTIAGVAAHGQNTAFVGKVADDDLGAFFTNEMVSGNITFPGAPLKDGDPTGRCIVLITPDAERTMHTLIGAAAATAPSDLDMDVLASTACFFSEGYVFDSPSATEAFHAGAGRVKAAGGRVAFSLSDPFCVERHMDKFTSLLAQDVDLVLGNESEAAALFGTPDMPAIAEAVLSGGYDAVITRGEKGALIVMGGAVTEVPAVPVAEIVDLTGAGDQYAAGFLSGLALGKSAAECGHMGAVAAAEVISHIGPRPRADMRTLFARAGIELDPPR